MKIAVVLRQVPDLVESLEVAASGDALDFDRATFVLNEYDDHALEQAILLKEAGGATVTVVALDFGDVDNTLFTAAAKGADRVVKIPWDGEAPPPIRALAAMLAETVRALGPDLVLVGCQAHHELDGSLAPQLAVTLGLPYVGVVRGVQPGSTAGHVTAFKEFPGAVMARMSVRLPAVLGILAASQAPRYVPVSRIRAAAKSTSLEEQAAAAPDAERLVQVCSLAAPAASQHAEMLPGSEVDVASRIADILLEKGLLK